MSGESSFYSPRLLDVGGVCAGSAQEVSGNQGGNRFTAMSNRDRRASPITDAGLESLIRYEDVFTGYPQGCEKLTASLYKVPSVYHDSGFLVRCRARRLAGVCVPRLSPVCLPFVPRLSPVCPPFVPRLSLAADRMYVFPAKTTTSSNPLHRSPRTNFAVQASATFQVLEPYIQGHKR